MKNIFILICFFILYGCNNNQHIAIELEKKGDELHTKGLYNLALEKFLEAKTLYPNLEFINYNIGCSYFEMGEYEKAINYFDDELKVNYSDYKSHFFKAHALLNLERTSDALKEIEIGFRFDSLDAPCYFIKGMAMFQSGNYNEAIKDHSKAISINPGDHQFYEKRAAAYGELKEYANSISDLHKAIALDPKSADALELLTYSYLMLNNDDSCCYYYRRTKEINPSFVYVDVEEMCNR